MMKKLALSIPLSLLALLMVGCGRPVKWEYKVAAIVPRITPGDPESKEVKELAAKLEHMNTTLGEVPFKHFFYDPADLKFINELGAESWEMVSATQEVQPGNQINSTDHTHLVMIFKRRKP